MSQELIDVVPVSNEELWFKNSESSYLLPKWFQQNIEKNSIEYTVSWNDKKCSFEVKNPNEEDIGTWICSIRLDLGGYRKATVRFPKILIKREKLDGKKIAQLRFAISERIITLQLPFDYFSMFLMSTIDIICAYIFSRNHKQNRYQKLSLFESIIKRFEIVEKIQVIRCKCENSTRKGTRKIGKILFNSSDIDFPTFEELMRTC